MNRSTNFGQPIEHVIPHIAQCQKKSVYQKLPVHQVFEITIQERISDISENLIMKIRNKDKNWRKQEFFKKGYKKYNGSKKVHRYK